MKKWSCVLLGVLLLSSCGGSVAPTDSGSEATAPTAIPERDDIIAVEGVIEPARWTELHSDGSGQVIEVVVEEGDSVAEGDVLVRIDPTDEELAVDKAEATLAMAEAQLAEVRGWPRPEEIALTEARLEVAAAMLSQAEAQQGRLDDGEAWADIASAQAALANAVAAEKQAYNLHERTMDCFTIKVPGVGERKICPALGKIEEQARFSWHTAGDQLAAAQAQLGAVQNLAVARTRDASAAVESAAAQRDATQALLDLQKAGNQSERIAAAEAEVAGAEASLARAQAALEDTNIRAPFAGTMAQVNVEVGDTAVPGMVLLVLATLDELQVRTIDLTEIDVVRAAQGHPVVVTLEALPDTTLNGRVARIDPQSSDYRGDVTYPVIIELDEDAPGLRWGMTAMVEIEVD